MLRTALAVFALALGCLGTGCTPTMSEAVLLMNRSAEAIVKQQYSEAERLAREALEQDGKLANAQYDLGVALKHQGRHEEAIEHFQAALALFSPDDETNVAKCLYAVPLVYELAQDPFAASNAWRKYLAFAEQHPSQKASQEIARQRLSQTELRVKPQTPEHP